MTKKTPAIAKIMVAMLSQLRMVNMLSTLINSPMSIKIMDITSGFLTSMPFLSLCLSCAHSGFLGVMGVEWEETEG